MSYTDQAKIPPWSTPDLWCEANEAMTAVMGRHAHVLKPAKVLAGHIEQDLAQLDGIMGLLCAASCPDCADNCCHRATVWYDFKDLIFMHFSSIVPVGQIVKTTGRPCPHSGARGCKLQRTARPFICTWYLCPDHQAHLGRLPSDITDDLMRAVARLKRHRLGMENAFVRAITG